MCVCVYDTHIRMCVNVCMYMCVCGYTSACLSGVEAYSRTCVRVYVYMHVFISVYE